MIYMKLLIHHKTLDYKEFHYHVILHLCKELTQQACVAQTLHIPEKAYLQDWSLASFWEMSSEPLGRRVLI